MKRGERITYRTLYQYPDRATVPQSLYEPTDVPIPTPWRSIPALSVGQAVRYAAEQTRRGCNIKIQQLESGKWVTVHTAGPEDADRLKRIVEGKLP